MDENEDVVLAALAARIGDAAAAALIERANGYSNLPNAVKGMAKSPADPPVESAALALIGDPALESVLGLEPFLGGDPYPTQE